MISNLKLRNKVFSIFCSLIMFGCSNNSSQTFTFQATSASQRINNVSELFFWNTSTMSKPDKFLEPCFFEISDLSKSDYKRINYGEVSDFPVVGYFDEDQVLDYGVYRFHHDGSNEWIIENGVTMNKFNVFFGEKNEIPIPSDYNSDGKFDLVVYRSIDSTFRGILSTNEVKFEFQLGNSGDIPVPKDYDGDGRADFATYNRRSGEWIIRSSRTNIDTKTKLGGENYLPIPRDYDGDGKADLCVWDFINNSVKLILTTLRRPLSASTIENIQHQLKDKDFFPVPMDYDGDGASELAFWSDSLKLLLCFDIRDKLKVKAYHLNNITNSLPVTSFLLKRYILKNRLVDHKSQTFVSDFDGDYIPDACLWSKDTGTFICNSSRTGLRFALPVGVSSDFPIVGNFNADNISDIGVYRQKASSFYIRYLGKFAPKDIQLIQLDQNLPFNCIPHIDDYDHDGIDDLAVYNPSEKTYIIKQSSDLQVITLKEVAI